MSWNYEFWKSGRVIVKRDNKGRFVKGHRHLPKETKDKISLTLNGRKLTKLHVVNMSEGIKKSYLSSNLKKLRSDAMKERYKYPENLKRHSERMKLWWKERGEV